MAEPAEQDSEEKSNKLKEATNILEHAEVSQYNFFVHGKQLQFAPNSLFFFPESSKWRQRVVWLIEWKWFDRLVLLLILTNSVLLGLSNYSLDAVNLETLEPDPSKSWRNWIPENTELLFTCLFTLEAALKILGMGFILDRGAYLRNGWNWLDFIVVASGLLQFFPGVPQMSSLRAVRVLRPLRSLTVIPGMKVLVVSLLESIPQLLNVLGLLAFTFLIFGTLGLVMWNGMLHAKCRLLPKPIQLLEADSFEYFETMAEFQNSKSAESVLYLNDVLSNRTRFPFCGDSETPGGFPIADSDWTSTNSPWSTPRECIWPMALDDDRVCTLVDTGQHDCAEGYTCGSNFDDHGNPRFVGTQAMRYGETFFGFIGFDWIGQAFLTIFQCITMEGWVDVMYMVQDAHMSLFAAVYFCLLILSGSFFMLNLTLAVIWENFSAGQKAETERLLKKKEEAERHARIEGRRLREEKRRQERQLREELLQARVGGEHGSSFRFPPVRDVSKIFSRVAHSQMNLLSLHNLVKSKQPPPPPTCAQLYHEHQIVRKFNTLVCHPVFNGLIVLLIVANTVVLSMDRYPIDPETVDTLEIINFSLTCAFTLEMCLKLIGLGFSKYLKDAFNVFDALIVIVSLVELLISPPQFIEESDNSQGGAISALRTFRLFRVFKLARSWSSLRSLLGTIVKTLGDVASFAILLMLFMYIYTLLGMQFFSNRLHFDPITEVAVLPNAPRFAESYVPRSHFDDLLWAFVTIFQVLTGENWNTVMYDCWRAIGWKAAIYFFSLVVMGNFIVLNLFLAILLGNFENSGEEEEEEEKPKIAPAKKKSPRGAEQPSVPALRTNSLATIASQDDDSDHSMILDGVGKGKKATGGDPSNKRRQRRIHRESAVKPASVASTVKVDELFGPKERCRHCGKRILDGLFLSFIPSDADICHCEHGAMREMQQLRKTPEPLPLLEDQEYPRGSPMDLSEEITGLPKRARRFSIGCATEKLTAQHKLSAPIEKPAARPLGPGHADFLANFPSAVRNVQKAHKPDPYRQLRRNASIETTSSGISGYSCSSSGDATSSRYKKLRKSPSIETNSTSISEEKDDDTPAEEEEEEGKRDGRTKPPPLNGHALFLLAPDNGFRVMVASIVQNPIFDNAILLLIVSSSVMLALDNPRNDPASAFVSFLTIADKVMACIFTVEMVLKIVSWGFLLHKRAYLRNVWNVLDFGIVCVSWMAILGGGSRDLKSLRSLRTFRALRPLRMISRWPGLKLVVNALVRSIPSIINVLFVCLLFFLIFGIVGVNYFKGAFYGCVLDSFTGEQVDLVTFPLPFAELSSSQLSWGSNATGSVFAAEYIAGAEDSLHSRALCEWMGSTWEAVLPQSFDNIFWATTTLFEISTTEMWVDVMISGVDARGIYMQPVRDWNVGWALFFIAFMIVGSFFVMNLFVGVVVDNFNRMREELGGNVLLTASQREWVAVQRTMLNMRPMKKRRNMRLGCIAMVWKIVNHSWFDSSIMVCIGINSLVMAMTSFDQSETFSGFSSFLNYSFTLIFTLEMVLKLLAFKMEYFNDSWNRFDFLIVIGTNAGLVLSEFFDINLGTAATVFRTVRVCRIARLIKGAERLKRLFRTLVLTFPSLANVGSLLALMMFIYGVMGVQLFALVGRGDYVNDHTNFYTFWTALLTLARASTGESWNGIMYEMAESSNCVAEPQYNSTTASWEDGGCGTTASYAFWLSYTLLVTFVMLNVFIAVILEGFNDTHSKPEEAVLSQQQFDSFASLWADYDPDGTGFMPVRHLLAFFGRLPSPMGFAEGLDERRIRSKINTLNLATYLSNKTHTIYFADVCLAVSKRVFAEVAKLQDLDIPKNHDINKAWKRIVCRPGDSELLEGEDLTEEGRKLHGLEEEEDERAQFFFEEPHTP